METPEGESNEREPVDHLLDMLHKFSHLNMASLDAMLEEFEKNNWIEG